MTDLTFQNPDEAAAWDAIVTALVAWLVEQPDDVVARADALILERRKRMAPEKVGLSEDQVEALNSFNQIWDKLRP
jgi:hypothetical protein